MIPTYLLDADYNSQFLKHSFQFVVILLIVLLNKISTQAFLRNLLKGFFFHFIWVGKEHFLLKKKPPEPYTILYYKYRPKINLKTVIFNPISESIYKCIFQAVLERDPCYRYIHWCYFLRARHTCRSLAGIFVQNFLWAFCVWAVWYITPEHDPRDTEIDSCDTIYDRWVL